MIQNQPFMITVKPDRRFIVMAKIKVISLLLTAALVLLGLAGCNSSDKDIKDIGIIEINIGSQEPDEDIAEDEPEIEAPEEEDDEDEEEENDNEDNADEVIKIEGDVVGQLHITYGTKWFTFIFNSMEVSQSYAGHNAADGNILAITNITITNTFTSPQPFGIFDWNVDADGIKDYIIPMDPLNDKMMPENYTLEVGETVTYYLATEIPNDLKNPVYLYKEVNSSGEIFASFKIAIE